MRSENGFDWLRLGLFSRAFTAKPSIFDQKRTFPSVVWVRFVKTLNEIFPPSEQPGRLHEWEVERQNYPTIFPPWLTAKSALGYFSFLKFDDVEFDALTMRSVVESRIIRIESLNDPRVLAYRNLKDRELAREGGRFIAEGEHVVRRLIASEYPTESVFLAERRVEEIATIVPNGVPIYVAPSEVMHGVIGFKFHSGVIGCGRRREPLRLDDVMARPGRKTLVICPELANAENLGVMIRICAGFGVDAMILGERSCDPFWRQSIRVSMGNVFRLPIVQSEDLLRDMRRLREQWGVQLIATVLDAGAEPLNKSHRGEKVGLVFGNEAQGLNADQVAACDRKVTIPMSLGTDSLNVSVAAGIFLYHFCQAEIADAGTR